MNDDMNAFWSIFIRHLVSSNYLRDILVESRSIGAEFQGFAESLMLFFNHILNTMLASWRKWRYWRYSQQLGSLPKMISTLLRDVELSGPMYLDKRGVDFSQASSVACNPRTPSTAP